MTVNPLRIRGLDHVSWTVAEIGPVVQFYRRVFGAEILYTVGPVDAAEMPIEADGRDWTEARLGVAGARLQFVMLGLPGNIRIEVFSFAAPGSRSRSPLANSEIGASHLGLDVEDLEVAAGHLRNNGCTVFERIDSPPGSATAGISYRYVRDPWGNVLELCGRFTPND